jgi:hypothetical protein
VNDEGDRREQRAEIKEERKKKERCTKEKEEEKG